jgi:hypothetical protein
MGLWLILLSLFSGLCYRLGGIGRPFRTWMRDWLCPLIAIGALLMFWHPGNILSWLILPLCYLMMGGSLTTYWDETSSNGEDNFYMHGFMVGFAFIPLAFVGIPWYLIVLRAIVLSLFMGLLNVYAQKWFPKVSDWIEEIGRGISLVISIPLFIL